MHDRLSALAELFKRYGAVLNAAWRARHELDAEPRLAHELAFLPAHLELVDTPVHPAPKWAMRALLAFAGLALLWSIFGKLDIVATAKGKLVPNARVKVVQPLDTGIVRRILVQDGQRVKAGQSLIELDVTQAQADVAKTRAARVDAQLTIARTTAVLAAEKDNTSPKMPPIPDAPADRYAEVQRFADGQFSEYRQKIDELNAELAKRTAELDTTRRQVEKLRLTAPLARERVDSYRALVAQQYVSREDYLEKEQTRIEQEQELRVQQSRANELSDAVIEQRHAIEATAAQFRREQLDALNQAQQQLSQLAAEETKAAQRATRMDLRAPVDGTVQQLSVHTAGGVVTQAQALMEIVPDDTLEVQANLENKDVGFVRPGQDAIVKIDTFPYTRYGYLTGKVSEVPNDATQDKKQGLVYPIRVRLPSNRLRIEGQWVSLSPGMTVTVEVKTGKRRVAEYFLSPLVEYGSESLRER